MKIDNLDIDQFNKVFHCNMEDNADKDDVDKLLHKVARKNNTRHLSINDQKSDKEIIEVLNKQLRLL